jgi:alpha-tubulin suppressor-like RCC1 family protein
MLAYTWCAVAVRAANVLSVAATQTGQQISWGPSLLSDRVTHAKKNQNTDFQTISTLMCIISISVHCDLFIFVRCMIKRRYTVTLDILT